MARDRDTVESASSGAQSQRPTLSHRESDSQSDATSTQSQSQHHHHRPRAHQHHSHHHQRQHHVGGRHHHTRAAAPKTSHKAHAPQPPKLNRRITSPGDVTPQQQQQQQSASGLQPHRRATSEVKLPLESVFNSPQLTKSASHTSLQRNRSHADVNKRTKSSDKLKRSSSGTKVNHVRGSKSQVHFDLGDGDDDDCDQEDEWVDASGSNSPYLSRKGSFNSSAQSSLRPVPSAPNSRPQTPNEPTQRTQPRISTPERERAQQKEYLTSRLLKRTPSQGAPPQMTADTARVAPPQLSPDAALRGPPTPTTASASTIGKEGLTSRFVESTSSRVPSEGSFYHSVKRGSHQSDDLPRLPLSMASLAPSQDSVSVANAAPTTDDDSVLAPKAARRSAGPPAQTSRTQQKLNLQRASSVLEPGQNMSSMKGVGGSNRLIGVGGPGFDSASSRDIRAGRLLERTGMEYLVVRRYQNPIARSLNRLDHLPGIAQKKRIPRPSRPSTATSTNGKRSLDHPLSAAAAVARHTRNVSMPDPRRPLTPKPAPPSTRASGTGSSLDGEDDGRLNERLSGSSLVGEEEDDSVATQLRNMWEKSTELSASTD